MKTLKRRLSTGDVRKEDEKKAAAGKKIEKEEKEEEEEGMRSRTKSMDNMGKHRWSKKSPKLKKKKKGINEISDAELVFSTYNGNSEPLNTLQRKHKELNDIEEKQNEQGMLQNEQGIMQNEMEQNCLQSIKHEIVQEVISKPIQQQDVKSEDLNALRELLFNLEDGNNSSQENIPVGFTLKFPSPPSSTSSPKPKTPTTTPQGIRTPIDVPQWQKEALEQNGRNGVSHNDVNTENQLRKSSIIDEELFEKLRAVQNESRDSGDETPTNERAWSDASGVEITNQSTASEECNIEVTVDVHTANNLEFASLPAVRDQELVADSNNDEPQTEQQNAYTVKPNELQPSCSEIEHKQKEDTVEETITNDAPMEKFEAQELILKKRKVRDNSEVLYQTIGDTESQKIDKRIELSMGKDSTNKYEKGNLIFNQSPDNIVEKRNNVQGQDSQPRMVVDDNVTECIVGSVNSAPEISFDLLEKDDCFSKKGNNTEVHAEEVYDDKPDIDGNNNVDSIDQRYGIGVKNDDSNIKSEENYIRKYDNVHSPSHINNTDDKAVEINDGKQDFDFYLMTESCVDNSVNGNPVKCTNENNDDEIGMRDKSIRSLNDNHFDSIGEMRKTSCDFNKEEINNMENTIKSLSRFESREIADSETLEDKSLSIGDDFDTIDTPVDKEKPDSLFMEMDDFTTSTTVSANMTPPTVMSDHKRYIVKVENKSNIQAVAIDSCRTISITIKNVSQPPEEVQISEDEYAIIQSPIMECAPTEEITETFTAIEPNHTNAEVEAMTTEVDVTPTQLSENTLQKVRLDEDNLTQHFACGDVPEFNMEMLQDIDISTSGKQVESHNTNEHHPGEETDTAMCKSDNYSKEKNTSSSTLDDMDTMKLVEDDIVVPDNVENVESCMEEWLDDTVKTTEDSFACNAVDEPHENNEAETDFENSLEKNFDNTFKSPVEKGFVCISDVAPVEECMVVEAEVPKVRTYFEKDLNGGSKPDGETYNLVQESVVDQVVVSNVESSFGENLHNASESIEDTPAGVEAVEKYTVVQDHVANNFEKSQDDISKEEDISFKPVEYREIVDRTIVYPDKTDDKIKTDRNVLSKKRISVTVLLEQLEHMSENSGEEITRLSLYAMDISADVIRGAYLIIQQNNIMGEITPQNDVTCSVDDSCTDMRKTKLSSGNLDEDYVNSDITKTVIAVHELSEVKDVDIVECSPDAGPIENVSDETKPKTITSILRNEESLQDNDNMQYVQEKINKLETANETECNPPADDSDNENESKEVYVETEQIILEAKQNNQIFELQNTQDLQEVAERSKGEERNHVGESVLQTNEKMGESKDIQEIDETKSLVEVSQKTIIRKEEKTNVDNTIEEKGFDEKDKEEFKEDNESNPRESANEEVYSSACHEINKTAIDSEISKRDELIQKLLLKMAKAKMQAVPQQNKETENDKPSVSFSEKETEELVEEHHYTYANPQSRKISNIAFVIMKQYRSMEVVSDDEDDNVAKKLPQFTQEGEHPEQSKQVECIKQLQLADTYTAIETIPKQIKRNPPPGAIRVMLPLTKEKPTPAPRSPLKMSSPKSLTEKPVPKPRPILQKHSIVTDNQDVAPASDDIIKEVNLLNVESEVQFDWMLNEKEQPQDMMKEKETANNKQFKMPFRTKRIIINDGLLQHLEEDEDDGIELAKTPFFASDETVKLIKPQITEKIESLCIEPVESEIDFLMFDLEDVKMTSNVDKGHIPYDDNKEYFNKDSDNQELSELDAKKGAVKSTEHNFQPGSMKVDLNDTAMGEYVTKKEDRQRGVALVSDDTAPDATSMTIVAKQSRTTTTDTEEDIRPGINELKPEYASTGCVNVLLTTSEKVEHNGKLTDTVKLVPKTEDGVNETQINDAVIAPVDNQENNVADQRTAIGLQSCKKIPLQKNIVSTSENGDESRPKLIKRPRLSVESNHNVLNEKIRRSIHEEAHRNSVGEIQSSVSDLWVNAESVKTEDDPIQNLDDSHNGTQATDENQVLENDECTSVGCGPLVREKEKGTDATDTTRVDLQYIETAIKTEPKFASSNIHEENIITFDMQVSTIETPVADNDSRVDTSDDYADQLKLFARINAHIERAGSINAEIESLKDPQVQMQTIDAIENLKADKPRKSVLLEGGQIETTIIAQQLDQQHAENEIDFQVLDVDLPNDETQMVDPITTLEKDQETTYGESLDAENVGVQETGRDGNKPLDAQNVGVEEAERGGNNDNSEKNSTNYPEFVTAVKQPVEAEITMMQIEQQQTDINFQVLDNVTHTTSNSQQQEETKEPCVTFDNNLEIRRMDIENDVNSSKEQHEVEAEITVKQQEPQHGDHGDGNFHELDDKHQEVISNGGRSVVELQPLDNTMNSEQNGKSTKNYLFIISDKIHTPNISTSSRIKESYSNPTERTKSPTSGTSSPVMRVYSPAPSDSVSKALLPISVCIGADKTDTATTVDTKIPLKPGIRIKTPLTAQKRINVSVRTKPIIKPSIMADEALVSPKSIQTDESTLFGWKNQKLFCTSTTEVSPYGNVQHDQATSVSSQSIDDTFTMTRVVTPQQIHIPTRTLWAERTPTENSGTPSSFVTLEIRGDHLVEKGDYQRYENRNETRTIPIKLSSIQLKKSPRITVELRSSGLIHAEKKAQSSKQTETY